MSKRTKDTSARAVDGIIFFLEYFIPKFYKQIAGSATHMATLEQYIGTLIGTAIGDTLGMPVEGWKREQIQRYIGRITEPIDAVAIYDDKNELKTFDEFGKLKYYTLGHKKGTYTDDTCLTLALAQSLASEEFDLEKIAKDQLSAYLAHPIKNGFGMTTQKALANVQNGIPALQSSIFPGNGNGPAMKMAPMGLYMDTLPKHISEIGKHYATLVGHITHKDPRSVVSGVVQTKAVHTLLKNPSREEFIEQCYSTCSIHELHYPLEKSDTIHLVERIQWIRQNRDACIEEAYQQFGKATSPVYNSYPFALFMVQKFWDQPLEGLIETVNQGGDCDTTGAIYGALIGAKHGVDIFPVAWQEVLMNRQILIKAAEDLYGLHEVRKRTSEENEQERLKRRYLIGITNKKI